MELSRHELFEHLLDQLKMDKNDPAFKDGKIKQVIVHRKSKCWEFDIVLRKVMPYALFRQFISALQMSFSQLAGVNAKVRIVTPTDELDGKAVVDYWSYVVDAEVGESPMAREVCSKTIPEVDGNRVQLLLENEAIKDFFVKNLLSAIEEGYQKVGFPQFRIHPLVDQSASEQKIKELKAKQQQQDQELVKKAMERLQQQKAEKKQQDNSLPDLGDGPLVIGKPINPKEPVRQMAEITEEERNVVVEGYVFSKEVRELRSGRQLLILEVTDYTSSFAIKKFSNNKEDEAKFAAIKEGEWIKARGPVQEDTYMRDLTIMAYAIQQVSHPARKDNAEGEKRVELHLHTTMSTMDATNRPKNGG